MIDFYFLLSIFDIQHHYYSEKPPKFIVKAPFTLYFPVWMKNTSPFYPLKLNSSIYRVPSKMMPIEGWTMSRTDSSSLTEIELRTRLFQIYPDGVF